MAYKNLITSGLLNNPIETFKMFRDFMCSLGAYTATGVGWTYHDSYYAARSPTYGDTTGYATLTYNDYFVMKSTGEDGNRDLYFKVLYKSGYIDVVGYLYWNNSTHAGVQIYGAISNWNAPNGTNNYLWVYADLDAFLAIANYSSSPTNYYPMFGGWMPDSIIAQTVTVLAGTITAGSNVVCTFTSVPVAWIVDQYIFVRDDAHTERVRIKTIAGNDVTFYTFVNSYAANSKFCQEMTYYAALNGQMNSISLLIDHAGALNTTLTGDGWILTSPTSSDGLSAKYPCMKRYFSSANNFIGPQKNVYATLSLFTSLSTHTVGAVGYKYFNLYSVAYTLIKEV